MCDIMEELREGTKYGLYRLGSSQTVMAFWLMLHMEKEGFTKVGEAETREEALKALDEMNRA